NDAKIIEDSKGQLWVGATNALYKYDRATDRFTLYQAIENGTAAPTNQDQTGNLWLVINSSLGADRPVLFNPVNKKEVLFGIKENGKQHINAKKYFDIFKDKQQRIW